MLLTEPREKSKSISATTITMLENWVKENYFNRPPILKTDALSKGIESENEAIGLVNSFYGTKYRKSEENLENKWLTGHCDINGGNHIRDIKCSQSFTSFPIFDEEPEKAYIAQLNGYMWLTGARKAYVDKVLINSPDWMISKKLYYLYNDLKSKYGDYPDFFQEEYERESYKIFKDHVFDQEVEVLSEGGGLRLKDEDVLTLRQRIKTFELDYDEKMIAKIPEKVELCRSWLTKQGF